MRRYCEFCPADDGHDDYDATCCVCGGSRPRFPRLAAAIGWAFASAASVLLVAWIVFTLGCR